MTERLSSVNFICAHRRLEHLQRRRGWQLPIALIAASGSGLDSQISPAAAELQIARVARARNTTVEAIRALVQKHTAAPTFGMLGQARVNVLELNLELQLGK